MRRSRPPIDVSGRRTVLIGSIVAGLGCGQTAQAPSGPLVAADLSVQLSHDAAARGFVGVVLAGEAVDFAPPVAGRVASIAVSLGDRVGEDTLLATLDADDLDRQMAVAQAVLRGARAEAHRVEVEKREAVNRWDRRKGLGDAVSQEELEASRYDVQKAGAAVSLAHARVAEQRAKINRLRQLRSQTSLRAPFAGTITRRYVDRGAQVGPGRPLVRIAAQRQPRLRFAIPPRLADEFPVGTPIRVVVEPLGAQLAAEMNKVSPEVDSAAQMIFAEALLNLPPALRARMRSGMVARVFPGNVQ